MQDRGHRMACKDLVQCRRVADVTLLPDHGPPDDLLHARQDSWGAVGEIVEHHEFMPGTCQLYTCVGPDVAGPASDQNQRPTPARLSASDGAAASFADRIGEAPNSGHSMPIAGSFHAMLRSWAGA
ncbi:hypothetical protein D3C71_1589390 [compost metagenome]